MDKKLLTAALVCGGFILAMTGADFVSYWGDRESFGYLVFRFINRLFWLAGVPALVLWILYPWRQIGSELGVATRFSIAVKIGFIATLPMLIGYGFAAGFNLQLDLQSIVFGSLLAGIGEEVCFRGFLFGQLYRRVGLWFPLAAGSSALIFGLGHIYQGNSATEAAGVFAITLAGGVWFSWLFMRWQFNLWVPIVFHVLMNLYWDVFNVGDTALGGLEANIYRAAVIALSIVITIKWGPEIERSPSASVEDTVTT